MFCQLVFKMFFIIISLIASSNIEAFSVFLEKIDHEPHHTTNRVLNYQGRGVPLFLLYFKNFRKFNALVSQGRVFFSLRIKRVVSSCTGTQRNKTLTNCVTTPCMDMKTIGIPPSRGCNSKLRVFLLLLGGQAPFSRNISQF